MADFNGKPIQDHIDYMYVRLKNATHPRVIARLKRAIERMEKTARK